MCETIAHLHDDVTREKDCGKCSQRGKILKTTMAATENLSNEASKLKSFRIILTEDDIPGASLQNRKPESLKIEELKRWLKCRGGSVGGNRLQLLER